MSKRKPDPLASRIKKMMQKDDDVGRINAATPSTIGRAVELFLQQLCDKSLEVATERRSKTITPSHLKAFVMRESTMDFLRDVVSGAPDLAEAVEAEEPEGVKRRRTSAKGSAAEQGLSPQGSGHATALPSADALAQGLDTEPPTMDISRAASAVQGSLLTAGSSQALLSSPKLEPAAPPKRTRVSAKAKAAAAAAAGDAGDDNDDYEPSGPDAGTRGRGRRGPGRGRGRGRGGAHKGASAPVPDNDPLVSPPLESKPEQLESFSPQAPAAQMPATVPLHQSNSSLQPDSTSQGMPLQPHLSAPTPFSAPLPRSNSVQASPPALAATPPADQAPPTLPSIPSLAPAHASNSGLSHENQDMGGSTSASLPVAVPLSGVGKQLQQEVVTVAAAQLQTLPGAGGVSLSHFNAPMVADEDDDYDC